MDGNTSIDFLTPEIEIRDLRDENTRLQQLLKNRIIPQQDNAWKTLKETIDRCKSVFNSRMVEFNASVLEMQKRFAALENDFKTELEELYIMHSHLYSEHSRMISSLPEEARPSVTPKISPNLIRRSSISPSRNPRMLSPSRLSYIKPKTPDIENITPVRKSTTIDPIETKSLPLINDTPDDSERALINFDEAPTIPPTKLYKKPSQSPHLSLIAEESTMTISGVTPTVRKGRKRSSTISQSQSSSVNVTPSDVTGEGESTRTKRRAVTKIASLKEPSLSTKLRQPRTKKEKK